MGIQAGRFRLVHSLEHWINDGLMVLFFFVVGLEVKHEVVSGELRDPRRAALPIVAALGGMVVPAAIYMALQGGGPAARGWGIPMATDIAFVVGCFALLGPRVPSGLRIFALANAGVVVNMGHLGDPVAQAVAISLILGKPIGISLFSWLAVRANLARLPRDVGWGAIAGGGILAGIGFTMALFIGGLALDGDARDAAKVGILGASTVAAGVGMIVLFWTLPAPGAGRRSLDP